MKPKVELDELFPQANVSEGVLSTSFIRRPLSLTRTFELLYPALRGIMLEPAIIRWLQDLFFRTDSRWSLGDKKQLSQHFTGNRIDDGSISKPQGGSKNPHVLALEVKTYHSEEYLSKYFFHADGRWNLVDPNLTEELQIKIRGREGKQSSAY